MKLTILTVVKNDQKNIESTIQSVLAQDYEEFEYLIIDGNSNDDTQKIIRKFKNKKLKFFSIKDNSIYEALNFGVKKSIGGYIGMLHSGDLFYDNNVLKKISKKINLTEILVTNCFYFKNKNNKAISRSWVKPFNKMNKYYSYKISHTATFIKKSIFNDIGFYSEKYKISSDTEFLLRAITNKIKINYFNINTVMMKIGGKSTAIKYLKKKISEDLKIYIKYFGFLFFIMYLVKIFSKILDINFINKKQLL